MEDEIEFWRSGEWTMVYLNGELVRYGDHYLADEWLQNRCGVITVDDEWNASVPDGHNPVQTMREVLANQRSVMELRSAAEEKRAEAARLIAEADALESGK